MEQLQELYANEVHMEELAAREALLQSMCTSSITLFRYCTSRDRFFTAVKALVTQYLPASTARLYQVEKTRGDGLSLVEQDARYVALNEEDTVRGIAGQAALGVSMLTGTQWDALQSRVVVLTRENDLSQSQASIVSSTPSEQDSWIQRHLEFALPSSHGHLFLLLPLDVAYRSAGFHPDVDVAIKRRRDLVSNEPQLLVAVLRDAASLPIGVFEALISDKNPVRMEFLDAFSALLATALEARRSICRPTMQSLEIVVSKRDEADPRPVNPPPVWTAEIADGVNLLVFGEETVKLPDDQLLLEALQAPLADMWAAKIEWEQKVKTMRRVSDQVQILWASLTSLNKNEATASLASVRYQRLRSMIHRMLQEIGLDGVGVRVLFVDESVDEFLASYSLEPAPLSVEGQYSVLRRVIDTGERFESAGNVVALSIPAPPHEDSFRAIAGVLLVFDEDRCTAHSRELTTATIFPAITSAVRLNVWLHQYAVYTRSVEQSLAIRAEAQAQLQCQLDHQTIVTKLYGALAQCESVDKLARCVGSTDLDGTDVTGMTLFVAETRGQDEGSSVSEIQSIWTIDGLSDQRVQVYDHDRPRAVKGIAAYMIDASAPLEYSTQHPAYDSAWRHGRVQNATFYYAVTLRDSASGVLGVLEVAFDTRTTQEHFIQSALKDDVVVVITGFLTLHQHWAREHRALDRRQDDRLADQRSERQSMGSFLSNMSLLPLANVDTWAIEATALLHKLVAEAECVKLLVMAKETDQPLIQSIQTELAATSSQLSTTLNLLHHRVLRTIKSIPLSSDNQILGILVLSKASDEPFTGMALSLAEMAVQLLAMQLRQLERHTKYSDERTKLISSKVEQEEIHSAMHEQLTKLQRREWQSQLLSRLWTVIDIQAQAQSDLVRSLLSLMNGRQHRQESPIAIEMDAFLLIPTEDQVEWLVQSDKASRDLSICVDDEDNESDEGGLAPQLAQQLCRFVERDGKMPHSHVFTAPVNLPSSNGDADGILGRLVVLSAREDDVDELFVRDVARIVEMHLHMHNEIIHRRQFQKQLEERTVEADKATAQLNEVERSTGQWNKAWFELLEGLDPIDSQKTITLDILTSFALHELQHIVQSCFNVQSVKVWLHESSEPCQEIISVLANTDTTWGRHGTVELHADDGLYMARWKRQSKSSGWDGVLLVRWMVQSVADRRALPVSMAQQLTRMTIQLTLLASVAQDACSLRRRLLAADSHLSDQAQLIEDQTRMNDNLTAALHCNQRMQTFVLRLLSSNPHIASDDLYVSVFQTMEELPEYRLWILNKDNETLWMNRHGVKHVMALDASPAVPAVASTVNLLVDDVCVGRLERLVEGDVSFNKLHVDEMELLAGALRCCLMGHQSSCALSSKDREIAQQQHEASTRLTTAHTRQVVAFNQLLHAQATCDAVPTAQIQSDNEFIAAFEKQLVQDGHPLRLAVIDTDYVTGRLLSVVMNGDPVTSLLQWSQWASCLGSWGGEHLKCQIIDDEERLARFPGWKASSRTDNTHRLIAVVHVRQPELDTEPTLHPAKTIVATKKLSEDEDPAMTARVLESVSVKIASCYRSWLQQRANQSRLDEKARQWEDIKLEVGTAQDWARYAQLSLESAQQMLNAGVEALLDDADAVTQRSRILIHVRSFLQLVCGCERAEILLPDAQRHRQDDESGYSDKTQLMQSLVAPNGVPLATIRLQWMSEDERCRAQSVVDTAMQWSSAMLALLHNAEAQYDQINTLLTRVETLSVGNGQLELEGVAMKGLLHEKEHRRAQLETSVGHLTSVLAQARGFVEATDSVEDSNALWHVLINEALRDIDGVYGSSLVDRSTGHNVRNTTLSTTENDRVGRCDDVDAAITKCLRTEATQTLPMLWNPEQGDSKQVWVVPVKKSVDSQLVLLIFTRIDRGAEDCSGLQTSFELLVSMALQRIELMESTQVQTLANSALTDSIQELQRQVAWKEEAIQVEQRRRQRQEELLAGLNDELLCHPVWKTAECDPTSVPTARLVDMWQFLQDLTQERVKRTLLGDMEFSSAHLYGVVSHKSSAAAALLFSLPPDTTKRAFQSIRWGDLQQRKEGQTLIRCVTTATVVASEERMTASCPDDQAVVSGGVTLYFPIRAQIQLEQDEDARKRAVAGVLVLKLRGGLDDQLIQSDECKLVSLFLANLAPRLQWVARVLHTKQSERQRVKRRSTIEVPQPFPSATQYQDTSYRTPVSAEKEDLGAMPSPYEGPVRPTWSRRNGDDEDKSSNQDEMETPAQGYDSDEDRKEMQTLMKRHVSASSSIIDVLSQIQELPLSPPEDDKALRALVVRSLPEIWSKSSHEESVKAGNVSCDLFYLVHGALSTSWSLDAEPRSFGNDPTLSPPLWLQDFVQKVATKRLTFASTLPKEEVWQVDPIHWILAIQIDTSSLTFGLVTFGCRNVGKVIRDQQSMLQLGKSLRSHWSHQLKAAVRRRQDEARAQQRLESVRGELNTAQLALNAAQRLNEREVRLNALAYELLKVEHEPALRQIISTTLKEWLACDQIGFDTSSSDESAVNAGRGSGSVTFESVAMETVMRFRFVSPIVDGSGQGIVYATLIARLGESGRAALSQDQGLLDQLRRFTEVVGCAWHQLAQRQLLERERTTNSSAQLEIERLREQLAQAESEKAAVIKSVDDLRGQVTDQHALRHANEQLQLEVSDLMENLASEEKTRRAMVAQVRRYETQMVEVNCQLEQSIRTEKQLMRVSEAHAALQDREKDLEHKVTKQKLQLKQLMMEVMERRQKQEVEQTELMELRRQVAVLTEKQQHARVDASVVASAAVQAQLQAQTQTQAQTQAQEEAARVNRIQRRFFRQLQVQQHQQKRKQLDLAQELRQLAALEVHEMQTRESERGPQHDERVRVLTPQTKPILRKERVELKRSASLPGAKEKQEPATGPTPGQRESLSASRLRQPTISSKERRAPSLVEPTVSTPTGRTPLWNNNF
ncbi:hypothetical protein Poli38472_014466 [Pythium oligandrum]|uniref:Uncharacterized protein n=1 Tax=Pythium oligandrum TaxID=41045 RepID=A0A8K1FEX1_PYTOL|nr:hypothetical protein Poli38472_014466 [Pythium oligandrum]|eukprot:TMW61005.1 hypothetical protein Poli38472_014466 [Pythium oligandrum]